MDETGRSSPGTAGEPTHAALVAGVVGRHASPPPRRGRLVGWAMPVLLVGLACVEAAAGLRLVAALLVGSAVVQLPIWRRRQESFTEVADDGLHITSRGARRHVPWALTREFYVRSPWGLTCTVRTAAGSTVALPGVSDEAAEQLERVRAALAAVSPRG